MSHYANKVAIVTGAGTGIGAAIAKKLIAHKVRVVGFGRRIEKLRSVSDKADYWYPKKVDVTKENEVAAAFEWIRANLGSVHVVVNSASAIVDTTMVDGDVEKWRQVIDTNFMGTCIVCKHAIAAMEKDKVEDGFIINMNGIDGHYYIDFPIYNVFGASKFAITNVTETFRKELAKKQSKIRISCLSPGFVGGTDAINAITVPAELEKALAAAPKLRPENLADAVIYMIGQPVGVHVTEVIIRPTTEMF